MLHMYYQQSPSGWCRYPALGLKGSEGLLTIILPFTAATRPPPRRAKEARGDGTAAGAVFPQRASAPDGASGRSLKKIRRQ